MRLSKLIKKLNTLLEKEGDLKVYDGKYNKLKYIPISCKVTFTYGEKEIIGYDELDVIETFNPETIESIEKVIMF